MLDGCFFSLFTRFGLGDCTGDRWPEAAPHRHRWSMHSLLNASRCVSQAGQTGRCGSVNEGFTSTDERESNRGIVLVYGKYSVSMKIIEIS